MIVCSVYNTKVTGKDIGHNLLTKCVTLCNHLMCKMEIVILRSLLG